MLGGFPIDVIIIIAGTAFLCEYIDSTLGMGYGTALTPVLLLFGYSPLQIVPAVLISELITGLLAGFFHHRAGNVNLKPETTNIGQIVNQLNSLGYIESFNRGIPRHLKVALMLAACSILGTVGAVFVAVSIPKLWLKIYIGVLVLSMGILIFVCINKNFAFSWKKITSLGLLASFNKGISGGGYGPLVTCGQIMAGVEGKSAIGITSLAEALTCAVGVITYLLVSKSALDLQLAPLIIAGAVFSVPLSAMTVKRTNVKHMRALIGTMSVILGIVTLSQTFMKG